MAAAAALATTALGASVGAAGATAKGRAASGNTTAFVLAKARAVAATRPKGIKLPKETLGLVNVLYASPAAQRIQQGAVDAAKALGWTIHTSDANGNPTAEEADMLAYVNEHVNAIIDLSNATESIAGALAAAHKANIPVINIGGLQDPSPYLLAQFVNNDTQMAQALANYMVHHIKKGSTVALDEFPLLKSERIRDQIITSTLKRAGDKVVTHQANFAALVSDTQTATTDQLEANPNLAAIVGDTDAEMPVIAQVLKSRGDCAKVQNYNFYDDPQNLAAIREGCGTAVVTEPPNADGWAALDQLAQLFARKLPVSKVARNFQVLDKQWGIDFEDGPSTKVIDKSNLPPAGQYAPPKYNYTLFFTTVWHSEFGSSVAVSRTLP